MAKLRLALPDVSPAVLALALQEVKWETDLAEHLVQRFLAARGKQLAGAAKGTAGPTAGDGVVREVLAVLKHGGSCRLCSKAVLEMLWQPVHLVGA